MHRLRIALAQINVTVGDLDGNKQKVLFYLDQARALGVDLIAFPELVVTGYPPEDLLLKPAFIEANVKCLHEIVAETRGLAAIVGFVDAQDDLYNAAAVIHDGMLAGVYHKHYLPNYSVFDEDRYFQAGQTSFVFVIRGATAGVSICEDIWHPTGPPQVQALYGDAQVLVNISASPYHTGKGLFRERMLATRAADNVAIVAFCNLVGGQDELVFDGHSVVFNEKGELLCRGRQFEEDLVVADLELEDVFRQRLRDPRRRKARQDSESSSTTRVLLSEKESQEEKPSAGMETCPTLPECKAVERLEPLSEIYQALSLGTRDYVRKNGFQKVVIGLSGGIDSSLVAAIAADALGAENVTGVSMPSRYSSEASWADAQQLADKLGTDFLTISIDDIFQVYLDTLAQVFAGREPDVTEENIQARIRGNILMALSNKFDWLVLTTGNKSEMGVGYATLYGDMAGGFAVIKDVPKTLVYDLAHYRNSLGQVIPQRVLDKPPSAELRPDQRDTDSLPPYNLLDPLLHAYVEEDWELPEIVAVGFDEATVKQVMTMVDRSEYKRRQSPPGVRITPRAFGKDRRLPITNKFKSF
ncbi:MAG: NAD+ synthase [Anaerolineae bacterium]|nr:NAD+ synthase [Anaerolineae bacterium]